MCYPPIHIPSPYQRPKSKAEPHRLCRPDGAEIYYVCYPAHASNDADMAANQTDTAHVASVQTAHVHVTSAHTASAHTTPVVVLHGNGEEHGIFGPIIDGLVTDGYTVIGIDSRGQGQSTFPDERHACELTYEQMADDVVAVLDTVHITQAHVIGFSDGAILGLLLARDTNRVASLISVGANLSPEGLAADDLNFMKQAARSYRAWSQDGYAGAYNEADEPVPSPEESAHIADLLELMVKHPHIDPASLSSIAASTLVMAGSLDTILDEETERIAAAIPNSKLYIVEGIEHNIPKQAPEVLLSAARSWFAGHPAL